MNRTSQQCLIRDMRNEVLMTSVWDVRFIWTFMSLTCIRCPYACSLTGIVMTIKWLWFVCWVVWHKSMMDGTTLHMLCLLESDEMDKIPTASHLTRFTVWLLRRRHYIRCKRYFIVSFPSECAEGSLKMVKISSNSFLRYSACAISPDFIQELPGNPPRFHSKFFQNSS